jgi:retron-type reverse transcriptase
MDDIRTSMDNQQLTGAVFLDLRKAFDTVNHARLLNKLPSYGINDAELMWVSIYLFSRTQVVNFEGTLSEENYITHGRHGVPQGSTLGPLLFALQINDVGTDLSQCKIILYADDTVIYFSDKNASIIESTLNEEINRIAIWMRDNHLTLNLKK